MSKCHVRSGAIHASSRAANRWPRLWLMTDERMGDALLPSLAALPRHSGIIFRHYGLARHARQALLQRIAALARRHSHMLVIAGPDLALHRWHYAGRHGRRHGALTAPVHSRREAVAAQRAGAQLLFVSPLFATQSHSGASTLGRSRFGLLVRGVSAHIIALGGMTAKRADSLKVMNIHGWAAIDALTARKSARCGSDQP